MTPSPKLPERHTEDDHPEHHRARHLERMAQKPPPASPTIAL
jgi:hypothetical protein